MRRPSFTRALAISSIASLVLAFSISAQPVSAAPRSIGTQELVRLTSVGSGSLGGPATSVDRSTADRVSELSRNDLESLVAGAEAQGAARPGMFTPASVPDAAGRAFTSANPGFSGFNGLSHRDQRLAGAGRFTNTQFSLEPPDQALCVGNHFVVESVNTAMAVYSTSGTRLSGPTALNQFFGLAPEVIRSTPLVFGDFTSDPKCYFDAETNRFFLTLLQLGVDPPSGAFTGTSKLLVAVTTTGDPTGAWRFYSIDTTTHGGSICPCFGDQPLIGADHNGFFISTNVFSLVTGDFGGAHLYAMSKWALARGHMPPVVHIGNLLSTVTDGTAASVQPATMPGSGSEHDSGDVDENENGGTEYLVSSQLLIDGPANHIGVWALSNTASLSRSTPSLTLSQRLVSSQSYDVPPDAIQKAGPIFFGGLLGAPENKLSTNDHRMQQVVFARGRLWTALTTAIMPGGDTATRAGLAWFVIRPGGSEDNAFRPKIDKQGYVTIKSAYLMYPSIGVDRQGRGIMSFSFSSAQHFPSVGYVQLSRSGTVSDVHIAATGAEAADGFTGYAAFGGSGSERWGDYSAATDADGNVWFANEYVPGGPRTLFANWGTFIGTVTPQQDGTD